MIYAITSSSIDLDESIKIDAGVPIHIKVPGRNPEDQPYVGFVTKELGEKFLELKKLSSKNYSVVSIGEGLSAEYQNQAIMIFESEQQLIDMEKDAEGYYYESQIHVSA